MFEKIRRRLLLVLFNRIIIRSSISGGFAIAVRIVFIHSFYNNKHKNLLH